MSEEALGHYITNILKTAFTSWVLYQRTKIYSRNLYRLALIQRKRFSFKNLLRNLGPRMLEKRKDKLSVKHYGISLMFKAFSSLKWNNENNLKKKELSELFLEKGRGELLNKLFREWKKLSENRGLFRLLKKRMQKHYQLKVKRKIIKVMKKNLLIKKRLRAFSKRNSLIKTDRLQRSAFFELVDYAISKRFVRQLKGSAEAFHNIRLLKKFYQLWELSTRVKKNKNQRNKLAIKSYAISLLQTIWNKWKEFKLLAEHKKGRVKLIDTYQKSIYLKKAFSVLKSYLVISKKSQIIELRNKALTLKRSFRGFEQCLNKKRRVGNLFDSLVNSLIKPNILWAFRRLRGKKDRISGLVALQKTLRVAQLKMGFEKLLKQSLIIEKVRYFVIRANTKRLFISLHVWKAVISDKKRQRRYHESLRHKVK